jgi:biopolymer transport protein ExbB
MMTYLIQGGPLMAVILLCSVACGAFCVILWLRLKDASKSKTQGLLQIDKAIADKNWAEACHTANRINHPLFKPWQAGFDLLIEGKSDLRDIKEAVSIEGERFLNQLEAPLKGLGALVTTLPMLGFLGTILGLIVSFHNWEQMGAHVSISQLAGGIYQAMVTTAAALIVAIPYHLIYYFIAARIQTLALEFSKDTMDLFRKIKDALIHEVPIETESELSLKS